MSQVFVRTWVTINICEWQNLLNTQSRLQLNPTNQHFFLNSFWKGEKKIPPAKLWQIKKKKKIKNKSGMHEHEGIILGSSNCSNLLMLSDTMQVDNVKLWVFITPPPLKVDYMKKSKKKHPW